MPCLLSHWATKSTGASSIHPATKQSLGPMDRYHFYGPLPTRQYILVVLDCYSRFPEVEVMSSISAKSVIPKLDAVLAWRSFEDCLRQWAPFSRSGIQQKHGHIMRIQHTTSVYLFWPQGNAEVEAFMKPLGEAIRPANLEGRPWKQELPKLLLTHRSTPRSTTKVPPAQFLYNR